MTDRVILGPTRHPMPAEGRSRRVLQLPGIGPLEIWINQVGPDAQGKPDLFILKFPGTASRAEDPTDVFARWWPDLRIEIWAVNPPGYGGSGGRASLRHIPAMSHSALQALVSAAGGVPVVVVGESLGCVSALHLSARNSVDALLLRDPPPLRETIRSRHRTGLLGRAAALLADQVPGELDVIENAARSDAPAVMLLSQRDRVVPFELQCRVVDAYRGLSQHLVLPEADHGDPPSPSEYGEFKDLTGWLWGAVTAPPIGD
jgi:pimeloyl-ACP methyl ester carboxylesterase